MHHGASVNAARETTAPATRRSHPRLHSLPVDESVPGSISRVGELPLRNRDAGDLRRSPRSRCSRDRQDRPVRQGEPAGVGPSEQTWPLLSRDGTRACVPSAVSDRHSVPPASEPATRAPGAPWHGKAESYGASWATSASSRPDRLQQWGTRTEHVRPRHADRRCASVASRHPQDGSGGTARWSALLVPRDRRRGITVRADGDGSAQRAAVVAGLEVHPSSIPVPPTLRSPDLSAVRLPRVGTMHWNRLTHRQGRVFPSATADDA